MIESRDVLTFWLGDPDSDSYPESRMKLWFSKSDETDAEIRERFGEAVIAAGRGELDAWTSTPRGRLAVIILIDQFTRNIYRGSGDMYQFDHHALQLALDAIERGEDAQLHMLERLFLYLPLEHSEEIEHQRRCVALFEHMVDHAPDSAKDMATGLLDYAVKHMVIVERFGRFPHRNELLGRPSTDEEIAFLAEPGSSF